MLVVTIYDAAKKHSFGSSSSKTDIDIKLTSRKFVLDQFKTKYDKR